MRTFQYIVYGLMALLALGAFITICQMFDWKAWWADRPTDANAGTWKPREGGYWKHPS